MLIFIKLLEQSGRLLEGFLELGTVLDKLGQETRFLNHYYC